ncbi:MAG: hypothetical protein MJA84_17560 [Firmicutes bacterium]|nr:hypothetical protein [Bacillota bacterium]
MTKLYRQIIEVQKHGGLPTAFHWRWMHRAGAAGLAHVETAVQAPAVQV